MLTLDSNTSGLLNESLKLVNLGTDATDASRHSPATSNQYRNELRGAGVLIM